MPSYQGVYESEIIMKSINFPMWRNYIKLIKFSALIGKIWFRGIFHKNLFLSVWVGSRLKPLTWEPGTHNNLSDTQNYDSEISTPVRPPRSWLPRTNWSIGAKLESSGRHKETYVCVPPNVKSIYAALMMYSRTQGEHYKSHKTFSSSHPVEWLWVTPQL